MQHHQFSPVYGNAQRDQINMPLHHWTGQAIKTISGQAANTANRAAKLAARKQAHKDTIKKELKVQGAWQGLKQAGKCAFGEEKKKCEK